LDNLGGIFDHLEVLDYTYSRLGILEEHPRGNHNRITVYFNPNLGSDYCKDRSNAMIGMAGSSVAVGDPTDGAKSL
jgi:hypothetical protein